METEKVSIPDDAIRALESGNKIEAIKIVRLAYNLELKDSKDIVDAFLKKNAGLSQRYTSLQSERHRKWMMVFFIVLLGSLLFLFFSGNL